MVRHTLFIRVFTPNLIALGESYVTGLFMDLDKDVLMMSMERERERLTR